METKSKAFTTTIILAKPDRGNRVISSVEVPLCTEIVINSDLLGVYKDKKLYISDQMYNNMIQAGTIKVMDDKEANEIVKKHETKHEAQKIIVEQRLAKEMKKYGLDFETVKKEQESKKKKK